MCEYWPELQSLDSNRSVINKFLGGNIICCILRYMYDELRNILSGTCTCQQMIQYYSFNVVLSSFLCVFCCDGAPTDITRILQDSWWRHQMETFSASLALCEGNPQPTGGFPSQRPVTRSFGVLFDLHLKTLSINNQDAGDLRRHHAHYDVTVMTSLTVTFIAIVLAPVSVK